MIIPSLYRRDGTMNNSSALFVERISSFTWIRWYGFNDSKWNRPTIASIVDSRSSGLSVPGYNPVPPVPVWFVCKLCPGDCLTTEVDVGGANIYFRMLVISYVLYLIRVMYCVLRYPVCLTLFYLYCRVKLWRFYLGIHQTFQWNL